MLMQNMAVTFATKEETKVNGHFPNRWKRRVNIAARRATIYLAHYALGNTYGMIWLLHDVSDHHDLSDDYYQDAYMAEP